MKTDRIITDALGFKLEVIITIGDFEKFGSHITYADQSGFVSGDAIHKINIKEGLDSDTMNGVVAHEAYHLFYSIRPLITCDEETEAEVFGHLVRRIHNI